MSPFAHHLCVDLDDSSISSSSSSGESRSQMDRPSSYDSSPSPRDYLINETKLTSKLSTFESPSRSRNSDTDISNRASSKRRRPIEQKRAHGSDTDDWWDWEDKVEVELKDDIEAERSEAPSDDLDDRAYRQRRRQEREGKKAMNRLRANSRSNSLGVSPVQGILTDRKRTGRRRFRDVDDVARINQRDLASLSSPISLYPATRLSDTSRPPSLPAVTRTSPSSSSSAHSHPLSKAPTSASAQASIISPDPAHDDALTSVVTTSATTPLPSSTSSNTVGVVHHVASPIPVIAGTLAGIIALLAAIVVTIIVTRRNAGSRTRVRNRRSWLQQQRQHHAWIAPRSRGGGGGGGDDGSLSVGARAPQVRSRSAGNGRSGDGSSRGRARARDRDQTRERSRRRARSTSSSNETVSSDDDLHEIRSGLGMGTTGGYTARSFGGAVDFGARGSVARCFNIPGHHDTVSVKSNSGKVHKKKPPSDMTVNEDVNQLEEDVEQGYDDVPQVLDPPYIELHIRQHMSNNHTSKSPQHPSNTVCHYPPPTNAYGTMSSTSSSLSSPSLLPGHRRSSTHRHQHQYQHSPLSHHGDHTSPVVNMRPGHLTDQSISSISSPPPRTPPPLLHGSSGEFISLADVKHPNGPPDVVTRSNDTEDLPPAYDTM